MLNLNIVKKMMENAILDQYYKSLEEGDFKGAEEANEKYTELTGKKL